MERTVGIEPTTESLEGSDSANELRPHGAETRDRTRMSRASTARKDYLCYLGKNIGGALPLSYGQPKPPSGDRTRIAPSSVARWAKLVAGPDTASGYPGL